MFFLLQAADKLRYPHLFRIEDQFYTHQIVRSHDRNTLCRYLRKGRAQMVVAPSAAI
jgi:hypothetical protein